MLRAARYRPTEANASGRPAKTATNQIVSTTRRPGTAASSHTSERLPGALADVPTAKEQGYDLVWPIIRGFFMGPKVSDAEYQWWVDEFTKLQQTEAFKKQRELRGLFEFNMNGKELDTYVKQQVSDYREQAKAFGLAK